MAEELSQDSSKHQEASKDSGVSSEGQLSNPTGENTVEQNNQKSQAVTKQNNQNNKKYDLGVLFVHGIGFQERGDVFNEIYPAIVNEISSDESVVFEEIPTSSEKENQVRIIRDGKESSILFRESYWHGSEEDLNQTSGGGSSRLITTLLCLSWCVRILCLKFSQVRVGTPIFFASFVTAISLLFGDNADIIRNLLQATADRQMPRLVIVVVIFMIAISCMFLAWFMDVSSVEEENERLNENLSLYDLLLLERLTKKHVIVFIVYLILSIIYILSGAILAMVTFLLIMLLVSLYLYPAFKIFISKVVGLWTQIDTCADYIRSNKDLFYLDRVESDLDEILEESSKVLIVSHSMGEYLSYKVLTQDKYFNLSNIRLVSIGGGLGAVSLIGNSRVSDSEGNYSPINTLLVSSCVAFASMLNIFLFVYSWSHLFVDLWSIYKNFQGDPFSGLISSLIDILGIVISFFVGRDIIRFSGIVENTSKFRFHRYTHFFDPVGNFSNFAYGLNIIKNVTPKLSFGHGVSTYFFGASRIGQPGKIDDIKFMNMKYMQFQLVKHFNEFLSMEPCHDHRTENADCRKYRFSRKSIYFLMGLIGTVLFEFLGIATAVPLYNLLNRTSYVIDDPFKYIVAFGIFEYWGFNMFYVFLNKTIDIHRPKDSMNRLFWFWVFWPFFSFLIGVLFMSLWCAGFGILKYVLSVKTLL